MRCVGGEGPSLALTGDCGRRRLDFISSGGVWEQKARLFKTKKYYRRSWTLRLT
jgi:hypothetical protein